MKIHLVSLGCPKNLVDSEKILGTLGTCGVSVTALPQDSDSIIINTCGFIKPALDETEQEIEKALHIAERGHKKVYVYGCAVNRCKDMLRAKYPTVSGWFCLEEWPQLIRTIRPGAVLTQARLPTTYGYAYLKIADGCSNHCSYCTIPLIKKDYHSSDFNDIMQEANELVKLGTKELVLIAQDTTQYGKDRYGTLMLIPLVRELSSIRGLRWIRIMYAHAAHITEDIIQEIASNPKVCKYLDLPIQHINNRILKAMNRGTTRDHIEQVIKQLRHIKQISLRTTVIIGFPTETDDEFKELFEFLKDVRFDWLGIFPYYNEPETKAAQLDQVPGPLIEKRYNKVVRLQQRLIRQRIARCVGHSYKTLIHAKNGLYHGHTEFLAPEIDAEVLVSGPNLTVGNFYRLKIAEAKRCTLYGEYTHGTD
jgi:ribosomal protein S12 methylthiotransferase